MRYASQYRPRIESDVTIIDKIGFERTDFPSHFQETVPSIENLKKFVQGGWNRPFQVA